MSGKIWLIVEDRTDGEIIRQILKKRGIQVPIEVRQPRQGGISHLAQELAAILELVQGRMSAQDCIIVLHDADKLTRPSPEERGDYRKIADVCASYAQVKEFIARDELESWILADSGFCKWIKQKPKNWDRQRKPSESLDKFMKEKTGAHYGGRYRDQVIAQLAGDGDKHSRSMREAFELLAELDCVNA